jgi:hypothetical protein
MIRKIVTGVTVDKKERVVRFGLRTIPAVTDAVGEAYENLEKTKTASGDQNPFRRTPVAGTRLEPATAGSSVSRATQNRLRQIHSPNVNMSPGKHVISPRKHTEERRSCTMPHLKGARG